MPWLQAQFIYQGNLVLCAEPNIPAAPRWHPNEHVLSSTLLHIDLHHEDEDEDDEDDDDDDDDDDYDDDDDDDDDDEI
eukprot:3213486-Amphidinium_carterae.1